jgi:transposase InsO family protein
MTQQQYVIQRKLNILELGSKLGNISEACRRLGVSRQHFYDIKTAVEENGIEGLLEESKRKPKMANRMPIEMEEKILEYALQWPTHGQVRTANELLKHQAITVSPGGVRSVWLRHAIERKALRLKRLERWSAENGKILTEGQVAALEAAKEEKQAHGEIETHHPGFLLGQDTYYVGFIKGVGKIYQQTGIDTFSNVGFAKLYLEKTALAAADFVNDKVLPFFDQYQIPLLRTLTDRGTEYGYKNLEHPYQLFLHLNSVEHTRTKTRHPQTNGCTERLNQIIGEEFYQTAFRKKVFTSLDEMQADLDEYMRIYNFERTNQGKNCKGKTPAETFAAGLELCSKYLPYEKKPLLN